MTTEARELTTLRRLHELMCQVNAGEDLASVLQSLVDGVADVTGFAVAAVSYLQPDGHLEVVAVAGAEAAREQLIGTRTDLGDIADEFAIADDWGLLKFIPHERLGDEPARGWIPDLAPIDAPDAWHPEDALLAPLSAPTGELVGLLSVDVPRDGLRPGRFARDALEMYAVQAGIAISNAKQRERLREEVRLAAAIREVAHRAGNALDVGRVVDSAVAPIVQGLGCDHLWVQAFDAEPAAGRGRGAAYPSTLALPRSVHELAGAQAHRCWAERRALTVPDLAHPSGEDTAGGGLTALHDFLRSAGCSSMLLAPLGAGPECLGYLLLGRAAERAWGVEEVGAALAIGRDLGRALLHARLYEREHELVTELRQLDTYKTEMISTLAHELKTPLTAIVGHLELLECAESPAETEMSLAAMTRGTQRLSDLVSDLLLLSKVGDPRRELDPVRVDLGTLVTAAAELVEPQARKQGVAVEVEGTAHEVPVLGDGAELDRVVGNLLGNAVKFSPDGGTVRCRVSVRGDEVVLTCSDEGIGISEEDQRRLFTEFFRSTNPAALSIPGTGLGLTIVKRIIERHGGRVAVRSALGRGTTFTVALPLAKASEAAA